MLWIWIIIELWHCFTQTSSQMKWWILTFYIPKVKGPIRRHFSVHYSWLTTFHWIPSKSSVHLLYISLDRHACKMQFDHSTEAYVAVILVLCCLRRKVKSWNQFEKKKKTLWKWLLRSGWNSYCSVWFVVKLHSNHYLEQKHPHTPSRTNSHEADTHTHAAQ